MKLSHDRALAAACYVDAYLSKDRVRNAKFVIGYFGDTRNTQGVSNIAKESHDRRVDVGCVKCACVALFSWSDCAMVADILPGESVFVGEDGQKASVETRRKGYESVLCHSIQVVKEGRETA